MSASDRKDAMSSSLCDILMDCPALKSWSKVLLPSDAHRALEIPKDVGSALKEYLKLAVGIGLKRCADVYGYTDTYKPEYELGLDKRKNLFRFRLSLRETGKIFVTERSWKKPFVNKFGLVADDELHFELLDISEEHMKLFKIEIGVDDPKPIVWCIKVIQGGEKTQLKEIRRQDPLCAYIMVVKKRNKSLVDAAEIKEVEHKRLKKLIKTLEATKAERKELRKRIKTLRKEKKSLVDTCQTKDVEHEELRKQIKRLKKEKKSLVDAHQTKEVENKNLQEQIKKLGKKIRRLTLKLEKKES